MRFATFIATAAVLAATSAAAGPNLVKNGGFEMTTNGTGQFDSKTVATGWSSTGYNFLFGPGTGDTTGSNGDYGKLSLWGTNNGGLNKFVDSPTGGNFAAADGAFGVAPIRQTITGLRAGKKFVVSFDWAAAQQFNYTGDTTEQWKVSLGSQEIATAVFKNPSHGFSGWMHENFVFTATGPTAVLSFLAVGTPEGKPPFSLLDGVSGSTVPEPATWAMLVGGFGLVGVAARRRNKTVAA